MAENRVPTLEMAMRRKEGKVGAWIEYIYLGPFLYNLAHHWRGGSQGGKFREVIREHLVQFKDTEPRYHKKADPCQKEAYSDRVEYRAAVIFYKAISENL